MTTRPSTIETTLKIEVSSPRSKKDHSQITNPTRTANESFKNNGLGRDPDQDKGSSWYSLTSKPNASTFFKKAFAAVSSPTSKEISTNLPFMSRRTAASASLPSIPASSINNAI